MKWGLPPAVRFWAKVEKTEGCWLWTAAKTNGYGRFTPVTGGRMFPAHRWAYEQFVGPIPKGLTIDHLCRVRNCVNPAHLEPVTIEENLARIPGRTHCPHGHEFTEANSSYWTNPKTGRRTPSCRRCRADRARARRAAQGRAAA